jgi:pyridoxal phosphate enzyme (YggS family)
MGDIFENIKEIRKRIEASALSSGRDPSAIKLVAVTKGVDPIRIREAISAGAKYLGENYVQEARGKISDIGHNVEWHFIGHLQTNKVKYIFDLFQMIQSVDSLHLAKEIDRRAHKAGKRMRILVQVNTSGESSKFGIEQEEAINIVEELSKFDGISLEGLMTMAPYSDDPEASRPYFRNLRMIRDQLLERGIYINELSMGMSQDFEVAIQEGATMVRIGTAIFGPRL